MSDSLNMSTHSAPPISANEIPELAHSATPIWATVSTLAPARLYMTSDLRAATGLPRTHMDYYLREGLIVPTTRSESGYLLFDEGELATLRSIIADRAAGVPLRVIRARLGR